MGKRKVGILGFGSLGSYLYEAITQDPIVSKTLEIGFVWNRSADVLENSGIPESLRLSDLSEVSKQNVDIVVEVSHPKVSVSVAKSVVKAGGDFFCGSPTALADETFEKELREAANASGSGGLYIPSGALWGAADIQAMANRGTLHSLKVTMKKHPLSFRLNDPELDAVRNRCAKAGPCAGEIILCEGPVRSLCPLAPNNINTR